jgi:anti-sigma B factor antagonist
MRRASRRGPGSICEAGGVLFALDVSLPDEKDGGWAVLVVTGELELATAPRLRQAVVSLVGEGHAHIVLDLSGVDFVDSLGLGVIVSALKRARSHGGELVVAGTVPRVRELFELTRLDEIIELHPDSAAALAAHAVEVVRDDG